MKKPWNEYGSRFVKTKELRFSSVFLEPQTENDKYQARILINKDDKETYVYIEQAINAALEQCKEEYKMQPAKNFEELRKTSRPIVWDGDGLTDNGEEFPAQAKGHYVLTARTRYKPIIRVYPDFKREAKVNEFYGGMYGRITLEFYAYKYQRNAPSITCGFGTIIKMRDGERLIGREPNGDFDETDFSDLVSKEAEFTPIDFPM